MKKVGRDDILEIIKQVETVAVDVDSIKPDENLDLQGIDSLDMMSILFQIEDAFSIKIEEESIQNTSWITIDEIVKNTNALLLEKHRKAEP